MVFVFLSHDVDWRRQGPPREHILARRDRFEPQDLALPNPYYNTPEIMAIEEKFGVRSTFFFRTRYEGGRCLDYAADIKALSAGGWEIGLHSDPSSTGDVEKLLHEKQLLESITLKPVKGNRAHFLKFSNTLHENLVRCGFEYDSSLKFVKDAITEQDTGFQTVAGLMTFPITIMDAYLFTYMKLRESQIINAFRQALDIARQRSMIITVLWHDNVLRMKGGRMYAAILEYLTSQSDVRILRGMDLIGVIQKA